MMKNLVVCAECGLERKVGTAKCKISFHKKGKCMLMKILLGYTCLS